MCAGLRLPHTGQCVPGAQAGHQGAEEGPEAGDARRENQPADQEDHLPGTAGHVRFAERLCCIVEGETNGSIV